MFGYNGNVSWKVDNTYVPQVVQNRLTLSPVLGICENPNICADQLVYLDSNIYFPKRCYSKKNQRDF